MHNYDETKERGWFDKYFDFVIFVNTWKKL